jgi:hypothetical protein
VGPAKETAPAPLPPPQEVATSAATTSDVSAAIGAAIGVARLRPSQPKRFIELTYESIGDEFRWSAPGVIRSPRRVRSII